MNIEIENLNKIKEENKKIIEENYKNDDIFKEENKLLNEKVKDINKYQEENIKLNEKINEINNQIENINNENKKLKEDVKSKEELVEKLQITISTNLVELNDYMTKNQELLRKINTLKSMKKRSSLDINNANENEKLLSTIEKQKKEIINLQKLNQEKTNENNKLLEEIK